MATKKLKVAPPPPALIPPMFVGQDIMIDLETLDTAVGGVILSIGACRFNETDIDDNGFYRAITIQSNLDEHRTISPDTIKWWIDQSAKAKAVMDDPTAVSLEQALDELREWIGPRWDNMRVWGNGADFDIAMLKHAYNQQPTPWKFYNVRCFRTLKSEPAGKSVLPPTKNVGAHNALFDAIAQAQHAQAIWKAKGR